MKIIIFTEILLISGLYQRFCYVKIADRIFFSLNKAFIYYYYYFFHALHRAYNFLVTSSLVNQTESHGHSEVYH